MNYLKLIFILLLLLSFNKSFSQSGGVKFGYSSEKEIIAGAHLINGDFLYRITVSYNDANTKGKEVSEQKSNYGKTIDGTGTKLSHFDFSVGYYLYPNFTIAGELSIGSKENFTNYIDGRFSGGGYHMIDDDESIIGVGLNAGYIFQSGFGLFLGYNTIRKLSFGLTYDLVYN
jgi:hypothetical protein